MTVDQPDQPEDQQEDQLGEDDRKTIRQFRAVLGSDFSHYTDQECIKKLNSYVLNYARLKMSLFEFAGEVEDGISSHTDAANWILETWEKFRDLDA